MVFSVIVILFSLFDFGFSISLSKISQDNQQVLLNMGSSARKFNLKIPKTYQYLIVETKTLFLKTVTSEEFDQSRQNEITWFTACNGFTAIQNNKKSNNFEICIAGLEENACFIIKVMVAFHF